MNTIRMPCVYRPTNKIPISAKLHINALFMDIHGNHVSTNLYANMALITYIF